MDYLLKDRKAVVTGGTRGIGRAIAETLAREGCVVAVCARNADGVSETVDALEAIGGHAVGGVIDVADGQALKTWISDVGGEMNGIDVLVSNPSGGGGRTDQQWEQTFAVDLMGAVHATEAALPFLEEAAAESGDASIVVISSIAASIFAGNSSYGPIKAALNHFTKALAKEGAPKHVRANTISPGAVYFEGGVWHKTEQKDPDRFKTLLSGIPMGRMATPQDIANAAAFLASSVSSFTTGINMVVDGGTLDHVNY